MQKVIVNSTSMIILSIIESVSRYSWIAMKHRGKQKTVGEKPAVF